jgi:succinate dehydrogenase / fumarate reductase flavoprotein subunit
LHGANRLGGNSLSDLIVFGKLAGEGAANYIRALTSTPRADDAQVEAAFAAARAPLMRDSGENPYLLHEELQDNMQDNVGIIREPGELERGIDKLRELGERARNVKAQGASQYNPGWHEALSLRMMLITSEAVARAALMREESRGAHTRVDFENERDEWLAYNIVIRRGPDGAMQVEKVERPDPDPALAAIANSKVEDIEAGKLDVPEKERYQ